MIIASAANEASFHPSHWRLWSLIFYVRLQSEFLHTRIILKKMTESHAFYIDNARTSNHALVTNLNCVLTNINMIETTIILNYPCFDSIIFIF